MENILNKNGIEEDAIDNVAHIGGSSRIPKVQQVVSDFFGGKELLQNIDDDKAVASGAAVDAHNLSGSSGADKAITVVETSSHIEPCVSTAEIKTQESAAGATKSIHTSAIADLNKEILVKDLQVIKDILIKHKHVLSHKLEDVNSWLQNLQILENDLKNKPQATPSEREVIITAMLDTPLLNKFSNILYEKNIHTDGLKLNDTILKIQTTMKRTDHMNTIKSQFQKARCLDGLNFENGRFDATDALDLLQIVHEKQKQVLGESHEETLITEYHMVKILEYQEKYHDALNLAEKLYKMQCRTLGPEKKETLCSHVLVALCLFQTGKQNEAMELGMNLYEKFKGLTNDTSRMVVVNKHALAWVLMKTNKFKEALSLFDDVYPMFVSILGEGSFRTLNARNNIASCLLGLNEFSKALEIYTWVFDKNKEVLGPNHRNTLAAEHNIACTLSKQGKHKEAQDLFQQVYEKQVLHLGKNDPLTLQTVRNINATSG